MKPITKNTEEIFGKILDEKTKDLNTKLDEISAKMTSKPKEEKIEDIIKKMKDKIPERIVKKEQEIVKEPEVLKEVKKEPEHVHDDVFCPNCDKNHIHKMESSGLTMKCNGNDCGEEYFMIPKSSDSTCVGCGMPIKQSIFESKNLDHCPFCHGNKAIPFSNGKPVIKFDFTKMKK